MMLALMITEFALSCLSEVLAAVLKKLGLLFHIISAAVCAVFAVVIMLSTSDIEQVLIFLALCTIPELALLIRRGGYDI